MPWASDKKYFVSQIIWRQIHSKLRKQNFSGSLILKS